MTSTPHDIIRKHVTTFVDAIQEKIQISNHTIHPQKSDYPIFRPANQEYFEYKYYEELLEWYIRDYLVSGVILDLFSLYDIKYRIPEKKKSSNRIHFNYSNESFGMDVPFAFIVEDNGVSVGYRYSGLCLEDREFDKLLKRDRIHHIEIIDWTDTESTTSSKIEWGVSQKNREKVFYITLKKFFEEWFTDDLFKYYLSETRAAVSEVSNMIGFQTIPRLSSKELSSLKESIKHELANCSIEEMVYQSISESGKMGVGTVAPLPEKDCNVIKERVFKNEYYKALLGSEPFAKCFITAEYQYGIFQNGPNYSFDYTSVAVGYFKSLELLLEKIMTLTLSFDGHEKLWIKYKGKKNKDNRGHKVETRPGVDNTSLVRFKEEYKEFFSTEMGPLIHFIRNNRDGWSVSGEAREKIYQLLSDYTKGCRNEHLHKDLISDFAVLQAIRNNTLICLFYLLGGYSYGKSKEIEKKNLGIVDEKYDLLYKRIISLPHRIHKFYMIFNGEKEIKAIKLRNQEKVQYDDCGNIISPISFAKVDSFNIDDYDAFESSLKGEELIVLSRESIPVKVWWYDSINGRNLILGS